MSKEPLLWLEDRLRELAPEGKDKSGLAAAMQKSPSAVTNIIAGARDIRLDEMQIVADYLGWTVSRLFEALTEAKQRGSNPLDQHPKDNGKKPVNVREFVRTRIAELGLNLQQVSLAIGKNQTYIQQFITKGTPRKFDEDTREALATILSCAEDVLSEPRLVNESVLGTPVILRATSRGDKENGKKPPNLAFAALWRPVMDQLKGMGISQVQFAAGLTAFCGRSVVQQQVSAWGKDDGYEPRNPQVIINYLRSIEGFPSHLIEPLEIEQPGSTSFNGAKKDSAPDHREMPRVMDSERVVFAEEGQPNQYLKLIVSGELDDTLLEALEAFVKRQRKRRVGGVGTP